MARLVSETRLMWGMPITVAIVEPAFISEAISALVSSGEPQNSGRLQLEQPQAAVDAARGIALVFDYFAYIDNKFSTYKPDSEISHINRGLLSIQQASADMRVVFDLAEEMRQETDGYFNIEHNGVIDPSGLVKGWALSNAANLLREFGCTDFYVEAGGDFQSAGHNTEGQSWRVGIRNPYAMEQIVKVLSVTGRGVATSGTYIRGQHIYNPVTGGLPDPHVLSITVIGPDVYETDCFATVAFAMGRDGIKFIETLDGFEGFMIDTDRQATFTSGFERYINHAQH